MVAHSSLRSSQSPEQRISGDSRNDSAGSLPHRLLLLHHLHGQQSQPQQPQQPAGGQRHRGLDNQVGPQTMEVSC
ncbi:hypothetical protein JOQ06_015149 [Pogonophryne albipinna]|uniref:Uncharacterized protein n=1 Tax=Pogonophryne albipinna TaxID=1090488 RepID=A0AAD6FBG4_9TELE|nr:hypothetical protein JOQ06_015149 [Pogonophryne albipinna]